MKGRFSLYRISSLTRLYTLRCKCVLRLSSVCGVTYWVPVASSRRLDQILKVQVRLLERKELFERGVSALL
jgi:hypothetical protein